MNKHAYLLMIHHRKDLIDLLLEELDDVRNDIFVHIDKRCKAFSFEDFHLKHAGFYPVKQIEVNWGGYSQIKCEFLLMEKAKKHGPYAYYHLIQGSSFPLKNQDALHQFYDERQGTEFITIDDPILEERVRQLFLFNEYGRRPGRIYKWQKYISFGLLRLQQLFGYDHFKQFHMEYRKGFALWSITDDLLTYVLSKKSLIQKMLRFSTSGDEVMMQTLAYNSKFRDASSFIDDYYASSLWASTWGLEEKYNKPRKNNNFEYEDLEYLMSGEFNFARKFEGEDGIKLIEEIKKRIHEKDA